MTDDNDNDNVNTMQEEGILSSLRYYDFERQKHATNVTRYDGSNVDKFTTSNGEEILLCHLSSILPFTQGNYKPWQVTHEDLVAIALAAHHLNTGDGSIVPEITGLHERCNVKFTTEFFDTEFSAGTALNHIVLQSNRDNTDSNSEEEEEEQRLPCAFIGAYRSSISIPMSIVTGLLGYPQISGASTSVALDDTIQFPLFGRTIPSDQGNAIPIIIYLREVLNIQHLTVINVNDAYGNNYVDGMRLAAQIHAPDMKIHQIPLDDNAVGSIETCISNVKNRQYRYIFGIVFTAETHDALLTEAVKQGVAGDGLHNWLFADSFAGELDNRVFPKDSPLHKAYTGVGLLEASGGVTGIPNYDKFVSKMTELKQHPIDMEYLESLIPKLDHPDYPTETPFFMNDENFLKSSLVSGFAPFKYEAAISLGLAACEAAAAASSNQNNNNEEGVISGQDHFDQLKQLDVTGVAGTIKFDPTTGTRLSSSVLYKVSNWLPNDVIDPTTLGPGVVFKPIVTDLFQNSDWVEQTDYIFNDGTANLPDDLPPPPPPPPIVLEADDGPNLALVVALPVCLAFLLVVGIYLYLEKSKNKNDTVWKVKKEELEFASPPVVLGRGTFGMVLQAQYRGTQVAVKRVIPQKQQGSTPRKAGRRMSSAGGGGGDSNSGGTDSSSSEGDIENGKTSNVGMRSGRKSEGSGYKSSGAGGGSSSGGGGFQSGALNPFKSRGDKNASMMIRSMMTPRGQKSDAAIRKQLEAEFIEEMRYLSKLRHPCVTTVMGAVIGKGEEPMLVMEYMEHGSLYDILHNETMVIEGEMLLPLLRDVSQGVRFLHSADPQVIHGDLKAANILVDSKFRAKVADFGLSQKKNLGGTGTPFWMAPELLREESPNTSATDVYSFGMILYEVYSRRDPYAGEEPSEVLRLVADKEVQKRPPVPQQMPDQVKALMADCLDEDPDNRPTFEELDMRLKRVNAETAGTAGFNSVKPSNLSLFDIFPRHIAEALRDGRAVEPEHKEAVTIFFSDVVGYTDLSSRLEPRKVASMLDRLYTSFDELSTKHEVFKVETIGDSWMGAAGLVKDQPDDHVKRVALFAIDAVAAANATLIDEDDPDLGVVNIRVGFHSGPVVADVVGTRNPRYCLFGDTVNTASRMESNSKANRIQCSRDSAKLLFKQCSELKLTSRGKIPIKGKGEMQTFFVEGNARSSSVEQRGTESMKGGGKDVSFDPIAIMSRKYGRQQEMAALSSKLEAIEDILDGSDRGDVGPAVLQPAIPSNRDSVSHWIIAAQGDADSGSEYSG